MSRHDVSDSYYLRRVEVFNWGGFSGFHRADIHRRGTAIIGGTGSGKTTLVDALMTLLTARPSYNLASTGGHESDRDLIGYIRGQSGMGEDSVARAGKTVTAVAAYFQPCTASAAQSGLFEDMDVPSMIALGAVFWIDSTSNQPKDRHDLWLFAADGSTLRDWLQAFEQGGKRALKQRAKAHDAFFAYDSKSSYLSKIQNFFEAGDNAFRLLNRAVGLKQLNSIDEIFRELVLDDEALFAEAQRCIAQFDDLTDIRHTLETAKKQKRSLQPLQRLQEKWLDAVKTIAEHEKCMDALPYWYAWHAHALWQQQLDALQQEKEQWQAREAQWQTQALALQEQWKIVDSQYRQKGGNQLAILELRMAQQQETNARLAKERKKYQTIAERLSLPLAHSPEALADSKAVAREQRLALQEAQQALQHELEHIIARKAQMETDMRNTQAQLQQVAGQQSNIPPAFEQFRAELAAHLGCDMEALPYLAQLVEVKKEQSVWRGAIERALGSHRLRLLVPKSRVEQALDWVNSRHNHLHVRLFDEKAAELEKAQPFADGFVHKLNIKSHPMSHALMALLASLDRHCVASAAELKQRAHAITREGTMSGKSGRFDKHDQKRLEDNWLTGFDNRDLLQQLTAEREALKAQHQAIVPEYERLSRQAEDHRQTDDLYGILLELDYADIDLAGGEALLLQWQESYAALTAPDSELAALQATCAQLQAQLAQIQDDIRQCQNRIAVLQDREAGGEDRRNAAAAKLGEVAADFHLSDPFAALNQICTVPTVDDLPQISDLETRTFAALSRQKEAQLKARTDTEKEIVRQMNMAQQADTGALAEAGTEMLDLDTYLQRLQFLTEEDLPGKEKQFTDYLTQSSTESVSQLMGRIKTQIDHIKERIAGLNRILYGVDFDKDKYLQLQTVAVVHPQIKDFEQAYRKVNTFSLAVKNPDPEGHYLALRELIAILQTAVEKPERLSSKALLDARHRLSFSIAILSRSGEQPAEIRTGSQRGSGGEKEIMASYILTAALNYALSPGGLHNPKFATIVLDEAFSKSSQSVAGRIVSAIHAFGLHPLFVTPNKEMRLLREHTASAVLVHRKDKMATLSNWSWEKISAAARRYLEENP